MKRKPTHAQFIRAAIAAGIRWHDSGTVTHRDDGRKIGAFLKCDSITDEQRTTLSAALGPWVVFRTSRSQYAPEQVRALVILLSSPEMRRRKADPLVNLLSSPDMQLRTADARITRRIRRVKNSGPLEDKLVIGEYTVAAISGGVVSPTHGYYPPHPYARRVKSWAKRHGLPAPLY